MVDRFHDLPNEIIRYLFKRVDPIVTKFICHRWNEITISMSDKGIVIGSAILTPLQYKELYARFISSEGELEKSKWIVEYLRYPINHICRGASFGGHINILEWAFSQEKKYDEKILSNAIRGGQLKTLQILHEKFLSEGLHPNLFIVAAFNNDVGIMTWLHENGVVFNIDSLISACYRNSLDAMRWLKNNGIKLSISVLKIIAEIGNLNSLKWLRENFPPLQNETEQWRIFWEGSLCNIAAQKAHVHVLEWVFQIIYERNTNRWCVETILHAIPNGHLNILIWLCEHGVQMTSGIVYQVVWSKHQKILEWIYNEYGGQYWTHYLTAAAAFKNNFEMYKWLIAKGCEQRIYNIALAAGNENLEFIDWLCLWCRPKGFSNFIVSDLGQRLMHRIIRDKKIKAVLYLYNLTANRTGSCQITMTACKLAASSGQLELLKFFSTRDYFNILSEEVLAETFHIIDEKQRNEIIQFLQELRKNPPTISILPLYPTGRQVVNRSKMLKRSKNK
jgi:hypothetical protein